MPLGTAYCTIDDVQRILSVEGVNYRIDDDPSEYPDVIDEACREVDLYLLPHYSTTTLSGNNWVKYQSAIITAVLLCERRGNPVPRGVDRKYERLTERLERIGSGELHVPGAVRRRTDVPTLSAPRIRLDPYPRTVIERRRGGSANPPEDYPRIDDKTEWPNYQI